MKQTILRVLFVVCCTICLQSALAQNTQLTAPKTQPTDPQFEMNYSPDTKLGGTSIKAGVTFSNAEDAAAYLVLFSEGAATTSPADGVLYTQGDSLGNAYIALAAPQGINPAWSNVLKHNTQYTVTVYAYNYIDTKEVQDARYNFANPLSATFYTAPDKPAVFELVSSNTSSITIKMTPDNEGDKVFVVYSTTTMNPGNMGAVPEAGDPDASAQVGDQLTYINEDGESVTAGKVAYFGGAGQFTLRDLEPSTSYYFQAYSYNPTSSLFSQGNDARTSQVRTSTHILAPYTLDCKDAPEGYAMGGWTTSPTQSDYGDGFHVPLVKYANVTSKTKNRRIYECVHSSSDSKKLVYSLLTPIIEAGKITLSLDWHQHKKGSGYFASSLPYDEWAENDSLTFYVRVGDEDVVLKKYTADNTPTASDETTSQWHSETFDLSQYVDQNIQFGIKWHCTLSSFVYMGLDNLVISGSKPTAVSNLSWQDDNASPTYNLAGQRISNSYRGIVIQRGKKCLKH